MSVLGGLGRELMRARVDCGALGADVGQLSPRAVLLIPLCNPLANSHQDISRARTVHPWPVLPRHRHVVHCQVNGPGACFPRVQHQAQHNLPTPAQPFRLPTNASTSPHLLTLGALTRTSHVRSTAHRLGALNVVMPVRSVGPWLQAALNAVRESAAPSRGFVVKRTMVRLSGISEFTHSS